MLINKNKTTQQLIAQYVRLYEKVNENIFYNENHFFSDEEFFSNLRYEIENISDVRFCHQDSQYYELECCFESVVNEIDNKEASDLYLSDITEYRYLEDFVEIEACGNWNVFDKKNLENSLKNLILEGINEENLYDYVFEDISSNKFIEECYSHEAEYPSILKSDHYDSFKKNQVFKIWLPLKEEYYVFYFEQSKMLRDDFSIYDFIDVEDEISEIEDFLKNNSNDDNADELKEFLENFI